MTTTAPPPAETEKSTLHVLDQDGDSRFMWDKDNADEVEAARNQFDELKGKGFLAYKVKRDGTEGEVIRKFDPSLEKIIMHRPLAGG